MKKLNNILLSSVCFVPILFSSSCMEKKYKTTATITLKSMEEYYYALGTNKIQKYVSKKNKYDFVQNQTSNLEISKKIIENTTAGDLAVLMLYSLDYFVFLNELIHTHIQLAPYLVDKIQVKTTKTIDHFSSSITLQLKKNEYYSKIIYSLTTKDIYNIFISQYSIESLNLVTMCEFFDNSWDGTSPAHNKADQIFDENIIAYNKDNTTQIDLNLDMQTLYYPFYLTQYIDTIYSNFVFPITTLI